MKSKLALFILFAACNLAPLRANLISNGSFEVDACSGNFCTTGALTSWIVTGQVDLINNYWQHADGNRSIDLNALAPASIYQSFSTSVGSRYNVSFALSGNTDGGTNFKTLNVSAGSASLPFIFDTTGNSRASMGWEYQSFSFLATQAVSTLSFQSTTTNGGPFGPALDDISVNAAVPEPASGLLFAGAAVALALYRRRR